MIDLNIGLKHPMLEEVYKKFHEQIDWPYVACERGWLNLIIECDQILFHEDPDYQVLQIKEKFGGLRYYFVASNPALTNQMYEKISHIEKKSYTICERCGNEGNLRRDTSTGRFKTMCTNCLPKKYISASVSYG